MQMDIEDSGLKIAADARPVIILARPQMGENIGACARAMKNCGVYELRLINPRDGWPNPAAAPMAASATDILEGAQLYSSLGDALHDVDLMFATTARLRDMEKPVLNPRQAVRSALSHQANPHRAPHQRIAFLFGAERSGLDNDEVVLADVIVQAELNPGFSSLNVAQAVLMMCWEWRMAALEDAQTNHNDQTARHSQPDTALSPPASLQARSYFFDRLDQVMEDKGFFTSPDLAPTVKRNMRNFFTRGQPTEQELRTLHGLLSLFDKDTG